MSTFNDNKQQNIIFPVSLAMTCHSYNILQMRAVVAVAARLQSIFHDVINCRRTRQIQFFAPSELDEEGCLRVEVPLIDVGCTASHYAHLCRQLIAISDIPVSLPIKVSRERTLLHLPRLFSVRMSPCRGVRRSVVVTMRADVAQHICLLQMGYQSVSFEAVRTFRSAYSLRMYLLVSSWMGKGSMVMTTGELRRLLGVNDLYPRTSDLLRRILRPAAQEMAEAERLGLCECHFSINSNSGAFQRGSHSDEIVFNVVQKGADIAELTDTQRSQLVHLFVQHFGFTDVRASQMVSQVNGTNYQQVVSKLTSLYAVVAHRHTIKDRAAYVTKSLKDILNA